MAYFPLFVALDGKRCLVVGGGAVARRKVEKLLPYGPRIAVIAPQIDPALACIPGLELHRRAFVPADLEGCTLAVAATDDTRQNRHIAALCQRRGLPVNVVDDPAACTFLFPALVQRGALSIGISTGGASPSAAVWLKEQIEALLPENLDAILAYLAAMRPVVLATQPSEAVRARQLAALFAQCMACGRPLTQAEAEAALAQAAQQREEE